LSAVLVEKANPAVVVVDSFRAIVRKPEGTVDEMNMQSFIQRLALFLASWQATTFLIGEYVEDELRDNRCGEHSREIREHEITPEGLNILDEQLADYQHLLTGIPEWVDPSRKQKS
jgi:hypothetical protein